MVLPTLALSVPRTLSSAAEGAVPPSRAISMAWNGRRLKDAREKSRDDSSSRRIMKQRDMGLDGGGAFRRSEKAAGALHCTYRRECYVKGSQREDQLASNFTAVVMPTQSTCPSCCMRHWGPCRVI